MELADFLGKLDNVKSLPSGFSARCPAHDDRVSSLMANAGRDQPIVVHCHAGCTTEAVLDALGLSMSDIIGAPKIVALYQYYHADGTLAYEVERWSNPKTFRVRGHLPAPAERVLYQLPAIEWARTAGATVYIVEGERDADRLVSEGYVATTNVSGAGSWLGHYGESLRDCHVVIIADNDSVGRAHARFVALSVKPYATTVVLAVPRYGKDVSDLLDAGYGLDEIDPLPEQEDLSSFLAANVRRRRIDWAWYGYFALGKLSMIEGDPGDGKSILSIDLAARWSSGAPMPDGTDHGGPYHVVMVTAEDDIEDTILPRLIAANARLEHVTLIPYGSSPDRPFNLAEDLPALERRVMAVGAQIVMLDPLAAFLPTGTDSHNDMSVRQALYPLRTFAMRVRAALICIRHLNKGGSGGKAVYRGNGSIAFTGAARTGFLVAPEPEEPSIKVLACVKNNIALMPPSLRYAIQSGEDDAPFIVWKGFTDANAQEILDGPAKGNLWANEDAEIKRRERVLEGQFLTDILRTGPLSWAAIVDAGKPEGFSDRTLRRARADLGLVKQFGPAGQADTVWSLPFGHLPGQGGALENGPPLPANGQMPEPAPTLPFGHLSEAPQASTKAIQTPGKWPDGVSRYREVVDVPLPEGSIGPSVESAPEAVSTVDHEDMTAEQRYLNSPRVCDRCGSDRDVLGIESPLWTYRCVNHLPGYMED